MVFFETPIFSRYREKYFLDDDYLRLQLALIGEPTLGPVIPGSSGIRKLRWPGKGKGKRGGLRVIYYYITQDAQIYLLTLYSKGELQDLTKDQIKALKALVEEQLR
ncbi:MAG: type II toxin-antitoxin system RelE/ParE family toxin [Gammaproteobacteria bacterium]|nr:MAG: type II toxin-antitoxin system RelE/ParE family toxin [Gammaproteobacteria bacterium]